MNFLDRKTPTSVQTTAVSSSGFSRFATRTAAIMGSSWVFLLAVAGVAVWGFTGPYFHYSDSWQLVINTSTTIITFLMVFLIQNTQNRDARALHLKLDEVIRSHMPARNEMINIEKLSDQELDELARRYEQIRLECNQRVLVRCSKESTNIAPLV